MQIFITITYNIFFNMKIWGRYKLYKALLACLLMPSLFLLLYKALVFWANIKEAMVDYKSLRQRCLIIVPIS